MSAITSKKTESEAIESKDEIAARKVIQEVRKDYIVLVRGKMRLEWIFEKWGEWMKNLRRIEKRMVENGPSEPELRDHRDLVELMISFSASIAFAAERHVQNNYHLEDTERKSIAAQIELLQRHRRILEFELKGWHGPVSREELEKISQKIHGVSDSKAA